MSIVLPFIFIGLAFVWNIYPFLMLCAEILFGDLKAEREKEWRILAAKLALTELRMTEEINGTRKQLGMDPLPYTPVAAHLKGRLWGGLTLQVKDFVKGSLANIFWKPVA
jgi:hypothetical protein